MARGSSPRHRYASLPPAGSRGMPCASSSRTCATSFSTPPPARYSSRSTPSCRNVHSPSPSRPSRGRLQGRSRTLPTDLRHFLSRFGNMQTFAPFHGEMFHTLSACPRYAIRFCWHFAMLYFCTPPLSPIFFLKNLDCNA